MRTPTLLLFDLGGVLIELDIFERLPLLSSNAQSGAALKRRWLMSPAVRRFERAETSADEFAAEFLAEWDIALAPTEFLAEFAGWAKGFYPNARPLLRALRRRYRVGCFSNSNALHWEKFGGFAEDFDIAVSSHLLGLAKPDPAAFVGALESCAATAAETWFFDDSPANVEAARSVGLRAFQADGCTALEAILRAEGLI